MYNQTGERTFVSGSTLARYLRVKTAAAIVVAGSTDVELGVNMNAVVTSGDTVNVKLRTAPGTCPMVASGAITLGNPVYAAASGKIAASGTVLIGTALNAATADGDVVEVLRRQENSDAAAAGGTTASAFLVDSDSTTPKIELAAQTGGTGDFKATIKPPATLTANRVYTGPADSDQTLVGATATQTLTNKTLTAPVVTDLTEVVAATNVIAATESGSTFFLNSATEFVSTLPAPAAGLRFTFIVTAAPSGASYTIVTNASSNIIKGNVVTSQDAGGSADSETSGGDTISFVDGKAVAGDRVDVHCDGTNWFAYGVSKVFDAITISTAS
jgi:hypothetical protein